MQKEITIGITIFRLWRTVFSLKKMNLNAAPGAAKNPVNRVKFLTSGYAKTAEVLFTAATNHMLAMSAHFKHLGPECSAPNNSGTKTTERIIAKFKVKPINYKVLMPNQHYLTF